jgi:predicted molibdopterin-dependent oxidoreductase YjgC
MSEKISYKIDGIVFSAKPGTSILEAAGKNGIYIPHLCHHPDLVPSGVCRLCGVEVEGRGLVMSCITPVEEGMVISTNTETANSTRQVALELLMANHPEECLTCQANNDCELLRIANYVGIDRERLDQMRKPETRLPIDSSNPFFSFDPNKCVLCGICVRTCNEIQGVQAIDFLNRGYVTKIGTFNDQPFIDSICESCGECVVRCPVGSLAIKNYRRPAVQIESICSYCGVGCGLLLGVQGDTVVHVDGNRASEVNRGQLCVKGRFGYDFVNHEERLTKPKVREYLLNGDGKRKKGSGRGEWVEVEWETAVEIVAKKFTEFKKESGSDSVGVLASAKCTNEENYLFQKFARQVVGTHSIDHCARL